MPNRSNYPEFESRLMALVASALDRSINESELQELGSILAEHPEAQELYLREIETDFLLDELLKPSPNSKIIPATISTANYEASFATGQSSFLSNPLSKAFVICASLGLR